MNILLLTAYFPPDTGSAAHLFYELGIVLVERGHQVTILTSMPGYHTQGPLDRYKGKLRLREKVNGMNVIRVATPHFLRRPLVGRALWQFSGAATFLLTGLRVSQHDVAMVYSPPLPLGLTAWALSHVREAPFIFNVQDLFPQSAIDLGLLRNRGLIKALEAVERFIYARAAHITVHSPGNRDHVISKGAAPERVTVIPNWIDTDFIQPGERMNGFRQEYGLDDAFIVSFAGVLGYSQDLDVILEAARLIDHNPSSVGHSSILWLIVGDGAEKHRLETKAQRMGLSNVRFLPMQPRDKYPSILHASDVSLATLHAEVKTPVVPSKILSIMAAGRPVVAALNLNGDAPRLIEESQCGLCVSPEDPRALAKAVLRLYHNASRREELGRNGRRYAEQHLSLERCASQYEALFHQVANSK